ncbi:MAG: FAD-dependent oxidoreductase [Planctomycetota bacterium]|jgi:hypothetical protein
MLLQTRAENQTRAEARHPAESRAPCRLCSASRRYCFVLAFFRTRREQAIVELALRQQLVAYYNAERVHTRLGDSDAPRPPAVGTFLVLDGNGEGPVNQLCVPSEVAPNYAPPGRALVSASVVAPLPSDDEALEAGARQQLADWLGPEVLNWTLLRIDRIPDALPSQPPGQFEPSSRPARLTERLFICGDYCDLASLQGAMASGRRAAAKVADALS